jgi:hypothetical protein
VEVGGLLENLTHDYPEKSVHLKFFRCRLTAGEPRAIGCADFKWIARTSLLDHAFPAADARLLEALNQSPELWR